MIPPKLAKRLVVAASLQVSFDTIQGAADDSADEERPGDDEGDPDAGHRSSGSIDGSQSANRGQLHVHVKAPATVGVVMLRVHFPVPL